MLKVLMMIGPAEIPFISSFTEEEVVNEILPQNGSRFNFFYVWMDLEADV